MSLWICKACTTAYSVGAPACPHCGGRKHVEQGSPEHLKLLAVNAGPAPTVEEVADADS